MNRVAIYDIMYDRIKIGLTDFSVRLKKDLVKGSNSPILIINNYDIWSPYPSLVMTVGIDIIDVVSFRNFAELKFLKFSYSDPEFFDTIYEHAVNLPWKHALKYNS